MGTGSLLTLAIDELANDGGPAVDYTTEFTQHNKIKPEHNKKLNHNTMEFKGAVECRVQ